jgi:hypothetical protein
LTKFEIFSNSLFKSFEKFLTYLPIPPESLNDNEEIKKLKDRIFELMVYINNVIPVLKTNLLTLLEVANGLSELKITNQEKIHERIIEQITPFLDYFKDYPSSQRPIKDDALNILKKLVHQFFHKLTGLNKNKEKRIEEIKNFSQDFDEIFKTPTSINLAVKKLEAVQYVIEHSNNPCTFIIDRAGGGKTNLMCEMAFKQVKITPTILLFGKENFQGYELINRIEHITGIALNSQDNSMDLMDSILLKNGIFLHIFIDGINECRSIPILDESLTKFFDWAKKHRIKITITCRDIYWNFFESNKWNYYNYQTKFNELNQFTEEEYKKAINLYLKHFKIDCKLVDSAYTACQHPLLLRFFCEAFGNPVGEEVSLGMVSDIRLKKLFDEYYNKKLDQIRCFLHHLNTDAISNFLLGLTQHLFQNRSSFIYTDEIKAATGCDDTSSENSIYTRLLDEDIIIEEEPTQDIFQRRVNFVYEEFMEYVLAKSLIYNCSKNDFNNLEDIFNGLVSIVNEWVNARGVIEYIILILAESSDEDKAFLAFDLLEKLIQLGGVWLEAFWSIVGKFPEQHINGKLFDFFYSALSSVKTESESQKVNKIIKNSLSSISKYSIPGAERFASALLWSSMLPNILTWKDIDSFSILKGPDLKMISNNLIKNMGHGNFNHLKHINYKNFLSWIVPYLNPITKDRISFSMFQGGIRNKHDFKGVMAIVQKLLPEHQCYLINGLLHNDPKVALNCADRIRFIKLEKIKVIEILRQIIEHIKLTEVKNHLLNSIELLELDKKK